MNRINPTPSGDGIEGLPTRMIFERELPDRPEILEVGQIWFDNKLRREKVITEYEDGSKCAFNVFMHEIWVDSIEFGRGWESSSLFRSSCDRFQFVRNVTEGEASRWGLKVREGFAKRGEDDLVFFKYPNMNLPPNGMICRSRYDWNRHESSESFSVVSPGSDNMGKYGIQKNHATFKGALDASWRWFTYVTGISRKNWEDVNPSNVVYINHG